MDKVKLMEYVERIEMFNDTITEAKNSQKVIIAEAKSEGFSPKAINHIIKQRKKDRDERAEERELFDTYEKAAGLD